MTIALPKRRGFTLLEIILVVAILIIMLAAAMPSVLGLYRDSVLRGAADEVRRAMAEARSRAIDTGLPYRYCEKPGTDQYRVAPDSDEFWTGMADDGGGKAMSGNLPGHIKFGAGAEGSAAADWRTVAIFLPNGTAKNGDVNHPDDDAQTVLEDKKDGTTTITVKVRNLTGIVTVRTPKQEKGP